MMKKSLLVLAAGMGSRYGGIKQLDRLGPSGETIMDYSVYDALRAGFTRVVFVIRRSFEQEFRELFVEKLRGRVEVALAFQELDDLPDGFAVPAGRAKPWGTGHAMLAARELVAEPFAVINADDFYGLESYRLIAAFLDAQEGAGSGKGSGERILPIAMAGYRLENTLSEHGSVSRGLCRVDPEGYLESVQEHTAILRRPDGRILSGAGASAAGLHPGDMVSMNFWGFTPEVFPRLQEDFRLFLQEQGQDPKAEFYIPVAVDAMIRRGQARVRVLESPARWFGVTYPEDKQRTMDSIRALVEAGDYPGRL